MFLPSLAQPTKTAERATTSIAQPVKGAPLTNGPSPATITRPSVN
jgi:hypothetical protein